MYVISQYIKTSAILYIDKYTIDDILLIFSRMNMMSYHHFFICLHSSLDYELLESKCHDFYFIHP